MRTLTRAALRGALVVCLSPVTPAFAHGIVGGREFVEPFVTEDVNVMNAVMVQGRFVHRRDGDRQEIVYEIEKKLTPEMSLFLMHGANWNFREEEAMGAFPAMEEGMGMVPAMEGEAETKRPAAHSGFQNLEIGVKRQVYRSEHREALVSLAAELEVPTGSERAGAERRPSAGFMLLYAKGLGDLPRRLSWIRPLAVQGDLMFETPLGAGRPENMFAWNLAFQYHLGILHESVDFPKALEHLVFLSEFNFEIPVKTARPGGERRPS
ncbi:MAG: hypothetical protein A2Y95_09020 [Deltaproteobacteria bacterium RBG_13_65_10]|nr:MAG: hypothetical protein A2Y95_09020 [Deltaproteobacteria bacterium RBG_13_65_10]